MYNFRYLQQISRDYICLLIANTAFVFFFSYFIDNENNDLLQQYYRNIGRDGGVTKLLNVDSEGGTTE